MAPLVEAIAIGTPIIASNAIFATRRFSRGVDAMDRNVAEGIGNIGLCAGQTVKGFDALHDILKSAIAEYNAAEYSGAELIRSESVAKASAKGSSIMNGLSETIKTAEASGTLFGEVCKGIKFISENINPVIYAVGGIKVFGTKKEDRLETAAVEATALTAMRLGEEAYKKEFGMIKLDNETFGEMSPRVKKAAEAVKTQLKKSKYITKFAKKHPEFVKFAPASLKGLFFAVTSIECYALGKKVAKSIIGENDTKSANNAA